MPKFRPKLRPVLYYADNLRRFLMTLTDNLPANPQTSNLYLNSQAHTHSDSNLNVDLDAQLKLLLATQTNQSELGPIWMSGYTCGIQSQQTEPQLPGYHQDSLEIKYWLDGWHAGFYREPILFYDKADFSPINRSEKNHINRLIYDKFNKKPSNQENNSAQNNLQRFINKTRKVIDQSKINRSFSQTIACLG